MKTLFERFKRYLRSFRSHEWEVNETGHPFLVGWKCSRCGETAVTYEVLGVEPTLAGPCNKEDQ